MNIQFRKLITVIILTLTILACALPSQLSLFLEPTSTPTPTQPPTQTPTQLPTQPPLPMNTPTATSTATMIPTPTPIPLSIQLQDDGTTIIVDPEIGYQVTFPKGWGVVSLVGEELDTALVEAYEIYPELQPFEALLEIMARPTTRIIAVDMMNSHWPGDYVSLGVKVSSKGSGLEKWLDTYIGLIENTSIAGSNPTIIKHGVTTNSKGTELAFLDYRGSLMDGTIKTHTYLIKFQYSNSEVSFSFSIDEPLNGYAQQAIRTIQDSIQLLSP